MHPTATIEVQGHRGAMGLLPENTLPGFELALDLCVTSIETDVHLTRDEVAVVFHDAQITDRLCTARPGHQLPEVASKPLVRSLLLEQLRGYLVQGPAHPAPMPLAQRFAQIRGIDLYGIPTLAEFLDFVLAYQGALGEETGKTTEQREVAGRLIFDIELKRIPFQPQTIGDGFDGSAPALLEQQVVAAIRKAGVVQRTRLRSFDHRSVRAAKQLEPALQTAVLIHYTTPAQIAPLLEAAQADIYCPDYRFVDADVVRQVHAAHKRIMPYTINELADWAQLAAWGG